jgi:hypothetical protein
MMPKCSKSNDRRCVYSEVADVYDHNENQWVCNRCCRDSKECEKDVAIDANPNFVPLWYLLEEFLEQSDEAILVLVDESIEFGRIVQYDDEFCSLQSQRGTKIIRWLDVRFMSHDGFPVRKLFGADGSASIEKQDNKRTQRKLRIMPDVLDIEVQFGDPFITQAVQATLVNAGNSGPAWWPGSAGEEFEECLILHAEDGAIAHLFDIPTVYGFWSL